MPRLTVTSIASSETPSSAAVTQSATLLFSGRGREHCEEAMPFADPGRRAAIVEAAKARARERFLGVRHLRDHAALFMKMLGA